MAKTDLDGLEKALAGASPEPVYLVLGPAAWRRERAVGALRRRVLRPEEIGDGLAETRGRARECDVAVLLDSARTLPMGVARRLVLLEGAEGLRKEEIELLAGYARRPQPTTCLVIVGESLPRFPKSVKALSQASTRVECAALRAYEIPRWVEAELRTRQIDFEKGVPAELQEILGDDPEAIVAGVEKVLLYIAAAGKPRIRTRDVRAVLSRLPHGTVWEFLEALEEKEAPRALQAMEAILELGEPVESILRLISRSRMQLLAGLQARRSGGDDDAVLSAMGVAPKGRAVPRIRRAVLGRLSRHRQRELLLAFPLLLRADSQIKGEGHGEPRNVLTRLVLDLTGRQEVAARGS